MATRSCSVHSRTNDASKHSVNCSKAGFVSETPFVARDLFAHSESARGNVSFTIEMHVMSIPTHTNDFPPIAVIHVIVNDLLSMRNGHCLCQSGNFIQWGPQRLQDLTINFTSALHK